MFVSFVKDPMMYKLRELYVNHRCYLDFLRLQHSFSPYCKLFALGGGKQQINGSGVPFSGLIENKAGKHLDSGFYLPFVTKKKKKNITQTIFI